MPGAAAATNVRRMPARIIDGNALAASVRNEVKSRVAEIARRGKAVHLAAVLVGGTAAGRMYAQRQGEACAEVGIGYRLIDLPADASAEQVTGVIQKLNVDAAVTGIMLHLPLPRHLDETEMQYQIDRVKDVEGVNPANIGHVVYRHTLIAPCTALAVVELIKSTGVSVRGAETAVVGASSIAGKPAALLLMEEMATVSVCHIATKDTPAHTRRADIVVVAVGKPGLVKKQDIKPGAVVIDVGINRVTLADGTKKTVGDVDFDGVAEVAGYITPVPGGVGPMTVAMLLRNTLRSAELVLGIDLEDDAVPATTASCPMIPLKHLRHSELRAFLRGFLRREQATGLPEIYQRVLERFGAEACRPELSCPNYSTPHAEYLHIVRLTLWDGQRSGEFTRAGGGTWKLV